MFLFGYCVVEDSSYKFKELEYDESLLRTNFFERRSKLREIIELDDGFLDSLHEQEVLSRKHVNEIANSLYNHNDKFLDFLLFRYHGDYSKIMKALAKSDQQHVINVITSDGGMSKFLHTFTINCLGCTNNIDS